MLWEIQHQEQAKILSRKWWHSSFEILLNYRWKAVHQQVNLLSSVGEIYTTSSCHSIRPVWLTYRRPLGVPELSSLQQCAPAPYAKRFQREALSTLGWSAGEISAGELLQRLFAVHRLHNIARLLHNALTARELLSESRQPSVRTVVLLQGRNRG